MSTEATALTYSQAYDRLSKISDTLGKLDGRDLDQVIPMLEEAEAAYSVVHTRVASILANPLLNPQAAPKQAEVSDFSNEIPD